MVFTRGLSALLASPPAVRSAIFREAFAVHVKNTAVRGPLVCTGSRFSESQIKSHRRFQTTAAIAPGLASTTQASELPRRSRLFRFLAATGLVTVFFAAGFAMASAPAAEAVNGYLHSPSDAETLDMFKPSTPNAAEINDHIVNHPLARKLRSQPNITESRPHLKIPESMRPHNLTCGPLLGENKIEVPPLMFNDLDAELPSSTQFYYLGKALCGHPGIVHGGLLATLLDEGLARACFPALPNKLGVTASLKVDYKHPCPGNSYVVLKAETTKVEGRKAWVKGWIEILGDDEEGTGVKVVEAEALFIEPRHAAQMQKLYGGNA